MKTPERVLSLMLFGSTPGLRNSQAASWLPRVAKEGLRGFFAETIADRFPIDQVRRLVTGSSTRPARTTRPDRTLRRLHEPQEWSDNLSAIKCPTLIVMPGGETVGPIKNYDVMIEP